MDNCNRGVTVTFHSILLENIIFKTVQVWTNSKYIKFYETQRKKLITASIGIGNKLIKNFINFNKVSF